MNRTEPLATRPAPLGRLITCSLVGLGLALACCRPALAADAYYINNAIVSYPGTEPYPPAIDATNFINNSSFTINFTLTTLSPELFETSDTLNYTNNGLMVADTGFQFDTQSSGTGARSMAASFFNPGTIDCGLANELTGLLAPGLSANEILLFEEAQCVVNATNIVNPGLIDVGALGLIQLTGQNVNLAQSQLTLENFGEDLSGAGYFDLNTNFWDPSLAGGWLGPNYAESQYFPIPPYYVYLPDSTSYFDIRQAGSNNIIRAVFIEDFSGPDVAVNVYFDPDVLDVGAGFVAIQWAASYLDPATDTALTNYLYLENDYVLGASTNVQPILNNVPQNAINGIPANFYFYQSGNAPLAFLPAPTPPGYLDVFLPGAITNLYDVVNAQLGVAYGTNEVANLSVTNLPSRLQILASSNLDLTLAQVTGPNYISLQATNQFDGSAGALIQTPYADLNLGVTNGYPLPMTLSNAIAANLPICAGNVVAWNTRWLMLNTNTGFTNDYRILIVSSQISPTLVAQVQDLILHDTNSIVISDTFNVMRTLNANPVSLTLTTNPPGNGATSLDGELNLGSPGIFWQSSVPNLRFLTNNGAIRMQNLAYYGYPYLTNVSGGAQPATNVVSFLNSSAFINHGIFMDQGSIFYAGNFQSSGVFSNGLGSFSLQSLTTTLTNGILQAGGDVSITTGSLLTSNLVLQAPRSLTLVASNVLFDSGPSPTNLSTWAVGSASVGYGLSLPLKPAATGDLLGTTITLSAPTNRTVANVWAGTDYGLSPAGFTNNVAVGRLILDVAGAPSGVLTFSGAGVSNALYVDELVLTNFATQINVANYPWLKINTNLVIYYGRALRSVNGQSFDVSEAMDYSSQFGANGGRLRWVYSYAGYFSSTNLVYTNTAGVIITNTVNTALAQSSVIDSDSDGIPNGSDPTPFFVPSEFNFTASVTNLPPNSVRVQWTTIPNATNSIFYTTNLLGTNNWLAFTNFRNSYYGNNQTNIHRPFSNNFVSPQIYINYNNNVPDNSQQTNVWLYDTITNVPHFYKVTVWPNLMVNDTNAP